MNKVFIGVGHGGSDSGAVANGLKESNVNLVMALAMRDELKKYNVQVGISRIDDRDDRLTQEIKACNEFAPDLAVEVHNNAGGGDGFEVYYQTWSAKSAKLAKCIERNVVDFGQNSRGLKVNDKLGWIRQVNAPAVLCEGFFLDSADFKIADTQEKQANFGRVYAHGVLEYLGIPLKKEETALSYEEFKTYMKRYENEKNALAVDSYAEGAWEKAQEAGLLDGTMPQGAVSREQLAVVLQRCQLIGR